MKYFICGFTGAGKSFMLGQLQNSYELAGFQFFDTDFMIDQDHADRYRNLAELIEDMGMDYFRELEKEKLRYLNKMKNIIVALGGGTIDKEVRDMLDNNGWRGFWLNTDFEKCVDRVKHDENRVLSRLTVDELFKIYKARLVFYKDYQEVLNANQILRVIKD